LLRRQRSASVFAADCFFATLLRARSVPAVFAAGVDAFVPGFHLEPTVMP